MRRTFLLGTLLLAVPLSGCVLGFVREDDPVAIRLTKVEQQVARVERITDNQSLLQLAGKVDGLQEEVRGLRGELEIVKHQLQMTQDRQRDLYLDIDRRLQALEGGAANSAPAASGDNAAYQAAFDLLKQEQYEQAAKAFADFLQTYPDSRLRDNAQYWLGEAHYVSRDFKQAVTDFRTLMEQYPQSAKLPDAWLKLGFCQYELGEWAKAREALTTVTDRYPDHPAAGLAKGRLERMQKEGH